MRGAVIVLGALGTVGCAPAVTVRPAPPPAPTVTAAPERVDEAVPDRLRFPLPGAMLCSRGFSPADRHFAIDIPAAEGTPVMASGRGRVVRASAHPSYGLMVVLRHPGLAGAVYTLYAHLSALAVSEAATVEAGEIVGAVGTTGNARGAHLHFEVLEAERELVIRPDGPLGLRAEEHRVDPATVVVAPTGCGGVTLSAAR